MIYPPYLQGSIKDKKNPRGQAANARIHVGKKILITEDIRQFFPSVRRAVIFDIWQRFFRFPPEVAECLTKLTTKDGTLPQGAKTSSLLANLVFWEDEWRLAADLHEHGIAYSRLTDDITCSSHVELSPAVLTSCIGRIRTLCERKGLHLKRQKQTIARSETQMITTKLLVNVKTSLPQGQRSEIRAAVKVLARTPASARDTIQFEKGYRRASGQVAYLKQHHPTEAAQLRIMLQSARPNS